MPHRGEQHDHIVHAAREHAADENPEQAGHVAELGGQHGSEQGAGGGDGGEMVPEEHVLVGIHIVVAVGVLDGRRHTGVIQVQHLVCNEQAVKTIPYRKDTQGCENHRKSVHTKPLLVKVAHTAIGRPPRSYPLTPLSCAVRHRSGAVLIYEFKGNGSPVASVGMRPAGPSPAAYGSVLSFVVGKAPRALSAPGDLFAGSNSQRAHRRGVGQTGGVEPPLRRRFAGACCLFWGAGGEKLPFRGARPSARDGGKIGRSGRRRVAVRRAGEGAGRRRRGRPIPHRGGRPFRRRGESVRQRRAWARPTRTAGNRDGAPEGCAVWAGSGAAGS